MRNIVAWSGFNIKGVISNSRSLLESVPSDCLAPCLENINLDRDELPNNNVLGVCWKVDSDSFSY